MIPTLREGDVLGGPPRPKTPACFRNRPGTNLLPLAPASHIGARHGIRRNGPCMRSRGTSAHVGHSPSATGKPPELTHSSSAMLSAGVAGRIGCTRAWRWSSLRNHRLASTYSARKSERSRINTLLFTPAFSDRQYCARVLVSTRDCTA